MLGVLGPRDVTCPGQSGLVLLEGFPPTYVVLELSGPAGVCLHWPFSTTVLPVSVLEVTPLMQGPLAPSIFLPFLCLHENQDGSLLWGLGLGPCPMLMMQSIGPSSLIQELSWLGVWPHQSPGATGQPSFQHVALGVEPVCAGVKAQLQHPHPCAQIPAQLPSVA